MGMSASQARFLGLTARKTNVEYEGQQINQERTALSNQTASYYTQMLGLGVPTPPSVDQFTKQVYTWQAIGGTTNTILQMIPSSAAGAGQNDYVVRYTYNEDVTAAASQGYNRITDNGQATPTYYANGYEMTPVTLGDFQVGTTEYEEYLKAMEALQGFDNTTVTKTSTGYDITTADGANTISVNSIPSMAYSAMNAEQKALAKAANGGVEPADADSFYLLGDTANSRQLAIKASNITLPTNTGDSSQASFYNQPTAIFRYTYPGAMGDMHRFVEIGVAKSTSLDYAEAYEVGDVTERKEENINAFIRFDEEGRPVSIKPENYSTELAISASSVKDEAAYDDAMNSYEMEKYKYEKGMEDINAKIEVIQSQDRNLELRLKQLDTEQKAISTEMEAVQKVISKNVETTFKTFNA